MISAIILAAGESKRMGQAKMLLPWKKSTVLQTIISTVQAAGVGDILVITGGARRQVEALVQAPARTVFNPEYAQGEMLSSLQAGLAAQRAEARAALIVLGDQPQVKERSVRRILEEYELTSQPIIVPSYHRRRGHPWLVARGLWAEILQMRTPETPREFLNRHQNDIHYIELDTASILQDLDTPEDYLKSRP
jgi:molybdenum cofactor cytidylyltransferase